MEYTGSNLNGKQFSALAQLASQQMTSRFGDKVRTETVTNAEEASFNIFSAESDPTQDTDRHGDTPYDEYEANRRKAVPVPFEKGSRISRKDVARMTLNPQNPIVQLHGAAFGRKKDKIIYAAALGTAYKGKDGTTAVAFKDESISINGDGTVTTLGTLAANATEVPMTYSKILTMQSIFNEADVDPGIMKYWAVAPNDIKHMMNMTEIISEDYRRLSQIDAGGVQNVLNFNFFWSNYLDKDTVDGTSTRTLAWAKDGLILAVIGEFKTEINILPTKKYDTGIYSTCDIGGVRMEGAKVHECLNLVTQTLTASSAR